MNRLDLFSRRVALAALAATVVTAGLGRASPAAVAEAATAPAAASAPGQPASAEPGDAARILRIEDRRESPEALLPFLESKVAATRARACIAMGRIAAPPDTMFRLALIEDALARRLGEDPSPQVRCAAAFALGLLQTPGAGACLAACLASGADKAPAVRAAAVEGLGRCGPDPHPAAIRMALGDADPLVVQAALLACWKGRRSEHLDAVLRLSRAAEVEIRWRAAYALMRLLGSSASGRTSVPGGARLTDDARAAALARLLELADDPDTRTRLQALRALGRAKGTEVAPRAEGTALAAQAEETLRRHLHDEEPRMRVEALRSLAALLEAADPQALAMLADPHPHVRLVAIESVTPLVEIPALFETLEPSLVSPSGWERAAGVLAALARCQTAKSTDRGLDLIRRAMVDPDWDVRFAAANGLAELWTAVSAQDSAAASSEPAGDRTRIATSSDLAGIQAELLSLMQAFLADDPRVAKAVAQSWVAACATRNPSPSAMRDDLEPLFTHDDEVMRNLALEETGRQVAALLERSPERTDLAPLLFCAERGAEDPSSDARQAAIAFLAAFLPSREKAAAQAALQQVAQNDEDRRLRQAAIAELERNDPAALMVREPGCGTCPMHRIEAGPQETDRSLADYARALEEAAAIRAAVIETGGGRLRVTLDGAQAPLTVLNFARLAEAGAFDGGRWHRVVPDFVVQDGCPRGDGWGGPGYAIRCELNPLHYEAGVLGMALSGKDTGGSQYFLTLSDQPHLDARYTIFGRLEEGWETMMSLPPGAPIERVRIERP